MTSFPIVDQYSLQGEAFSRAIRTGGTVDNSIEVAVGNMRVIDALFRSADSGGWGGSLALQTLPRQRPD